MVSRRVLICWLCCLRGTMWILEQPASSLLEWHPRTDVCHVCFVVFLSFVSCCPLLINRCLVAVVAQQKNTDKQFQRFVALARRFRIYRTFVWIGAYGGSSPKPTYLYSNSSNIHELYRHISAEQMDTLSSLAIKGHNREGKPNVTGTKAVKESENYPPAFGVAVANFFKKNGHLDPQACTGASSFKSWQTILSNLWFISVQDPAFFDLDPDTEWPEADLQSVLLC